MIWYKNFCARQAFSFSPELSHFSYLRWLWDSNPLSLRNGFADRPDSPASANHHFLWVIFIKKQSLSYFYWCKNFCALTDFISLKNYIMLPFHFVLLPRLRQSPPVYFVFFGLKIICARQAFLSLFETIIFMSMVNGQFASLVNFKIHRWPCTFCNPRKIWTFNPRFKRPVL